MIVTIHDALTHARQQLTPVSSSASLDAQVLLCDVLHMGRASILAHPEHPLTPEQAAQYRALIARRAQGEPVAYIRGVAPFYDREFRVTPAVLIPRPETEHLLELALEIARRENIETAVDVGTGSGALAITFKAHVPHATVYATDISPQALEVARANAQTHGCEVQFIACDLIDGLAARGVRPQLVMANLPYINRDEVPRLAVSQYEPHLALDGGQDGLDLIRRLLVMVSHTCPAGAHVLLEIGADQGARTLELGRQYGNTTLYQDYAGLDRLVHVVWRGGES